MIWLTLIPLCLLKQANFKKIALPRPAYDALYVSALIGLVTLTYDFLTSK